MNEMFKIKNYLIGLLSVLLVFGLSSCIDRADMIAPPLPDDETGALVGLFVKVDGTGAGTSWDDAMSPEAFRAKLPTIKAGETIYFAGGIYYTGSNSDDFFEIKKSMNIRGGYDPESKGYDVDIEYPSRFETIFSGDLNMNGKADAGDARIMDISTPIKVDIKGITIQHGYVSSGSNRPCIHVREGANVNIEYCRIKENVSDVTDGGSAGGPAIFINGGSVRCFQTEIVNNRAKNRGGAVRLAGTSIISELFLEGCLVANNEASGEWGGAIQTSGTPCSVYLLNTTVTKNHVDKGAAINSGDMLIVVNSTIVNNTANNGANGYQVRCESVDKFVFVNSIFTGENSTQSAPDIQLEGAKHKLITKGYNIFGFVGGAGKGNFSPDATDQVDKKTSDIFGTNVLADNGGFTQTIALPNELPGVASDLVTSFMVGNWNYPSYNVFVDQRGNDRSKSNFSIGAYEY